MKQKILLLLTFLCTVVTGAWADNVAKIGDTEYATFQEAITAANAATSKPTVTLQANVALTSTVNITQAMYLDMNGHNITATSCRALNVQAGTLIVKNGSYTNDNAVGGVISTVATTPLTQSDNDMKDANNFTSTSSVIRVGTNSSTTAAGINIYAGVTVSSDICYGITYFGKATYTITIKGKVICTGYDSCLSGNGTNGLNNANVTITNAIISYTAPADDPQVSPAIYKPETGTMKISGTSTTITGPSCIGIKCGTLTIADATLTANGASNSTAPYSNGIESDGSAILIENNDAYDTSNANLTNITITGGTITSANGYAINETIKEGSSEAVGAVAISGGTFTGNAGKGALSFLDANDKVAVSGGTFSSAVATAYCADGYAPKANGDGTYGVSVQYNAKIGSTYYTTLQEALDAASTDDIITALTKQTAASVLASGKTVKINWNGNYVYKYIPTTTGAYYIASSTEEVGDVKLYVYASTPAVASVTSSSGTVTYYESFAKAMSNTTSGTLTLLQDATETAQVKHGGGSLTTSKTFTIDLGGHTYTNNFVGEGCSFWLLGNNTVTIQNGTMNLADGFYLYNSTLTVAANATINGTSTDDVSPTIFVYAYSTLTVNGKVTGGTSAAIQTYGADTYENVATINEGAEVSATTDYAIYWPSTGILTVNGKVTGNGGIEMKAGTLNIGATANITATATETAHNANGSGTSTSGYAIAAVENSGYQGPVTVTIADGATITGLVGKATDNEVADTKKATVTSAVNTYSIFDDYAWTKAEGETVYTLTEKPDVAQIGETKYKSLASAVAAATEGCTVTLLSDVTLDARVDATVNTTYTIDLGGKTITPTRTCGNGSAFNIKAGNVTIQNGTIEASALTQTAEDGYNNECDPITVRSGATANLQTLTINIDNITGACAYAFDGGKINIVSGTYKNIATVAEPGGLTAMTVNQADVTTQLVFLSGGTFIGQDPKVGDNAKQMTNFCATDFTTIDNGDGSFTVAHVQEMAKIDGYVAPTNETAAASVETAIASKAVTENASNVVANVTADAIPTGATASYVKVQLSNVTADASNIVTGMTFDVKPVYVSGGSETVISNDKITSAITFRLPVDANTTLTSAEVFHEGSSIGYKPILGDATNGKYIEISASTFSLYSYTLSSISGTLTVYKGNNTKVENVSTGTWESIQATTPNAIAIINSAFADWAETKTNVLVEYQVTSSLKAYVCPNFVLTDDQNVTGTQTADFYTPVDFTAVTGSYSRKPNAATLSTVKYNSVCLPFAFKGTDLSTTAKALTFSYYDGNTTVYFNYITEVSAGTPCIIYDEGTSWNNITFSNTPIVASPNNDGNMKGSFTTTSIYGGSGTKYYSVNSENMFQTLDNNLYPFRSCLYLNYDETIGKNNGAKSIAIIGEDDSETTGIDTVNAKINSENGDVFNVNGIKVSNNLNALPKGLYIVNGKKVLVK